MIEKTSNNEGEVQEESNFDFGKLEEIVLAINDTIQNIAEDALQGIISLNEQLAEIALQNLEGFKYFSEESKEYLEFFAENGWTIYGGLDLFDTLEFARTMMDSDYSNNVIQEKVDNYMLENISKRNRCGIVKKIISNKMLSDRQNILEEIKISMKNKRHYSCVLLLMTTIEGIIFDSMEQGEWIKQSQLKSFIKSNSKDKMVVRLSVLGVLSSKFWANFQSGRDIEIPSDICRHAVLHGYDKNYGNEVSVLKLLILLDNLVSFLFEINGYEEEKNNERFSIPKK